MKQVFPPSTIAVKNSLRGKTMQRIPFFKNFYGPHNILQRFFPPLVHGRCLILGATSKRGHTHTYIWVKNGFSFEERWHLFTSFLFLLYHNYDIPFAWALSLSLPLLLLFFNNFSGRGENCRRPFFLSLSFFPSPVF